MQPDIEQRYAYSINHKRGAVLKHVVRLLPLLFAVSLMLVSCGYHNPYVYSGKDRTIYVTNWKNRTSELNLDIQIYQSLLKWFQKSGSLHISRNKDAADYILAGEIVSIDLPTLTYNAENNASEVKIRLKVRYILKDLNNGKVLIEQPKETWTEEYAVTGDYSSTKDNEDAALRTIIEELSQKIYQKALLQFSKQ